ncbi:hypothetical protein ACJIZ3_021039 [Penstemon smallii]|uniref:Uncharacterized protein n=1 Tax=Penstemon smallii TaxID=265156 RepID=A0ABD3SKX5_9LAMI
MSRRFLSQTLIRTATTSAAKPSSTRRISTLPGSSSLTEISIADAEAKAVEKIEDVIHGIIVKRSKPDWLPFVPGASYWVPPRRSSYGVAEIVRKLANPLDDDEFMSLTTLQGWPSSAFYVNNEVPSHVNLLESEESSTKTSQQEDGCSDIVDLLKK